MSPNISRWDVPEELDRIILVPETRPRSFNRRASSTPFISGHLVVEQGHVKAFPPKQVDGFIRRRRRNRV